MMQQKRSYNQAIDEVLVQYQRTEPEFKALDQRIEDVRGDLINKIHGMEESFWSDMRINSLR